MLFDFCKNLDRSEIVDLTHITSPFLKKQTIIDAINMLQNDKKSKSIHSIQQIRILFGLTMVGRKTSKFATDRVQRTQDLSPISVSKGALSLEQETSWIKANVYPNH